MLFSIRSFGPFDGVQRARLGPVERAEVRRLASVVAKNYERRAKGEAPDSWHWADVSLLRAGFYIVTGDVRREPEQAGLVGFPCQKQ